MQFVKHQATRVQDKIQRQLARWVFFFVFHCNAMSTSAVETFSHHKLEAKAILEFEICRIRGDNKRKQEKSSSPPLEVNNNNNNKSLRGCGGARFNTDLEAQTSLWSRLFLVEMLCKNRHRLVERET